MYNYKHDSILSRASSPVGDNFHVNRDFQKDRAFLLPVSMNYSGIIRLVN